MHLCVILVYKDPLFIVMGSVDPQKLTYLFVLLMWEDIFIFI